MVNGGNITLVITVALKKELPMDWLVSLGVQVHRLEALESGELLPEGGANSGVLFVVTGVGCGASERAARWIAANLTPSYVVNIGSAGVLTPRLQVGDWLSVAEVHIPPGAPLAVDVRLPFAWPEGLQRHADGTLITVAQPQLESPPEAWAAFDAVDMEAYAQAQVFARQGIPFHALKRMTDRPGQSDAKAFTQALVPMRDELRSILAFLQGPGAPEITVIVPVHDRPRRGVFAVQSALQQSLPAAQVIVVDDGSSDASADRLRVLADRVRLIRHPQNRGVSAARNTGLAAASTRWVAFLDSDDEWRNRKLEQQWRFVLANPYLRAFQSDEIWIRHGRRVNPRKHHQKPVGWIWRPSLQRCLITASAFCAERALLEDLGGFDDSLPACEDYDLWLRLARAHPVGLDNSRTVIKFGGHPDQLSKRYPAMDRFRVQALLSALDRESDLHHCEALVAVLRSKLRILADGSRKRGETRRAEICESILSSLDEADFGRPHGAHRGAIVDAFAA